MREFVRKVRAAGGEVVWTRRHLRVVNPSTGAFVVVSGTPSDWRTLRNSRACVRRIGLAV